jgi:putative membrane protein
LPARRGNVKVKADKSQEAEPEAREKAPGIDLGLERTVLAAERTLMAWIRTAISLISFGFTLYKFLQYVGELERLEGAAQNRGPRNVGLILIGLAMVILFVADVGHCRYIVQIGAPARRAFSIPFFVVIFLFMVASFLFTGILVRTHLF